MARFQRSYVIPSPYAANTALVVALQTIQKVMVEDLSWSLEFSNFTDVQVAHAYTPYLQANRLYTTLTAQTIISQVIVVSPCKRWRCYFFWSTSASQNGLTCIQRRIDAPISESAAVYGVFYNTSGTTATELTAGHTTILRIDTFGSTFNLQKQLLNTAGTLTNTAAMFYQHDLIKNAPNLANASMLSFLSANSANAEISYNTLISIDGQFNENHASAAYTLTPISTTPVWSTQPFEFIITPVVIYNMPLYSLRGWVYAYLNKPDVSLADLIQIDGREFRAYMTTHSVRQYFEVDNFIPSDLS